MRAQTWMKLECDHGPARATQANYLAIIREPGRYNGTKIHSFALYIYLRLLPGSHCHLQLVAISQVVVWNQLRENIFVGLASSRMTHMLNQTDNIHSMCTHSSRFWQWKRGYARCENFIWVQNSWSDIYFIGVGLQNKSEEIYIVPSSADR